MENIDDVLVDARVLVAAKWKRINKLGCCEEWKDFDTFAKWMIEMGYSRGYALRRFVMTEPFSPENCFVSYKEPMNVCLWELEFVKRWNKTVNGIRERLGMERLGVSGSEPDGGAEDGK